MDEEGYFSHIETWDDASFRNLMERYGQDVWNYAYFMTKDREAADDISQDVFIKAYTQIAQFRGQSTVKTWLLSIARNASLNYFRSAFIRKVILVDTFADKGASRSAEQEVLGQMMSEHIWRTLLQLPRKHREVLLLNVHYDVSVKEMARMLGVAEGTVKSRLSRARGKMEDMLKEDMRYGTT